jgi:hypothetical protein
VRVVGRSLEAAGIVDGPSARVSGRLPHRDDKGERLGYAQALLRQAAPVPVNAQPRVNGPAMNVSP